MNRFLTLFFLAAAFCGYTQTVSNFANVPNPDGIKVDHHSNIWVSYAYGTDTYRLLRISPEGFVFIVIETSDELGPFGVNDSIIWISSPTAGIVYKYNHSGERLDSVNVSSPAEIILESDGTWYLAQESMNRIIKYAPDNSQQILASGMPMNHSRSLAMDENGMLYTCNMFNADVVRINPLTGSKTTIATLPTTTPYSTGYISYHSGHLYIPSGLNCIYKLDTAGLNYVVLAGMEGLAGNYGGYAGTALFDSPRGVASSVSGDTLFVADFNNQAIRRIAGVQSLGLDDQPADQSLLRVYPNPSSGIVRLAMEQEQVVSAIVTDRYGRTVTVACSASGSGLDLLVSELSEGLYFVQVQTDKGNRYRTRFIRAA